MANHEMLAATTLMRMVAGHSHQKPPVNTG